MGRQERLVLFGDVAGPLTHTLGHELRWHRRGVESKAKPPTLQADLPSPYEVTRILKAIGGSRSTQGSRSGELETLYRG